MREDPNDKAFSGTSDDIQALITLLYLSRSLTYSLKVRLKRCNNKVEGTHKCIIYGAKGMLQLIITV